MGKFLTSLYVFPIRKQLTKLIQSSRRHNFNHPDAPYDTWTPLTLFAKSGSEETTLWGNVVEGEIRAKVVIKRCINMDLLPRFRDEVNAMIRLRDADGEHKVNLLKCGPDEANATVRLVFHVICLIANI